MSKDSNFKQRLIIQGTENLVFNEEELANWVIEYFCPYLNEYITATMYTVVASS